MNAGMTADAHTFVVQADLTKLACDLILIPTDAELWVTQYFEGLGNPRKPARWGDLGVRVTDAIREGDSEQGRLMRWVNTGSIPWQADQRVGWLLDGIREALDAAAESVRTPHLNSRARALVGLPLFGTGAGGFDAVRGEVLGGILSACEEASARYGYDVVITCWHRSDYAALQNRRLERRSAFTALSEALMGEAERLGKLARTGQLTLFLGAGVSRPAGLPSWDVLISRLAAHSTWHASLEDLKKIPVIDAASLLQSDLGLQFRLELHRELDRPLHAIGHALLASLRAHEAITTNFDRLYEQACEATFGNRPRTLPWERAEPGQPWLLKMHGDIDRDHPVLGREEFLGFDALWRPLASMVQAAMMTRHMLFVGYSLRDENFARLAREVSLLFERMKLRQKAGTVLTLRQEPIIEALYGEHMEMVSLGAPEAELSDASRLVEVFLDCVGMHAASGERSYLLDPRYQTLVGAADEAVVSKLRELGKFVDADQGDLRREVVEFLTRYGYRHGHDGETE